MAYRHAPHAAREASADKKKSSFAYPALTRSVGRSLRAVLLSAVPVTRDW
jgi:hypothetical protein